jgi:uracil-DNA glycosylase
VRPWPICLPPKLSSLTQTLSAHLQQVTPSWQGVVEAWQRSAQAHDVMRYVDAQVASGAVVYPADPLRALRLTALEHTQVVILGQDPYHGPGQAHGLAFSVPSPQRPPPSLRNIFAELQRDLGTVRSHPDLSDWAAQGVLLLNSVLTVEAGCAASHAKRGWESLTLALLQAVAQRAQPCAYLLWGAHAQQFAPTICALAAPAYPPLILQANHPSPLSARRPPIPFLGCGHFSATNQYLRAHGRAALVW